MIRTTSETPFFALWRDADMLAALVRPALLTTARYEPVTRCRLGTGHVDVLFEQAEQSCVVTGIRLDPNSLITRECSPFIWPSHVVTAVDVQQLLAIEAALTPWLRSLARARPMATEAIRRFAPSQRFDRAREAELLGAAPLEPVMRRMAAFIYAQRFTSGKRVVVDCRDEALAYAILAERAASIAFSDRLQPDDRRAERAFARSWYGVKSAGQPAQQSDVLLVDRLVSHAAPIVIETAPAANSGAAVVAVPEPAPLDLLFSFDIADAPAMSHFAVHAAQPLLRETAEIIVPDARAGSTGRIVLALSPEAVAMGGADVQEMETLRRRLQDEGFSADIVSDTAHPLLAEAGLIHICGAPSDAHTIAFAQAATKLGTSFVFDVPPLAQSPSKYVEKMLSPALQSALDDAMTTKYLKAYYIRKVSSTTEPEPTAQEYAQCEERFWELSGNAAAVLAVNADLDALRERLPPAARARAHARCTFAAPEPSPARIGHLVPSQPFAFAHAVIGPRSHVLFTALAAHVAALPFVLAGPVYDVDYLNQIRLSAPSTIVLADASEDVISALYRCAAVWVDAAPRPPSAAALMRAAACGALPVLAAESPLVRVAGADVPTFTLLSLEDCQTTIAAALTASDRAGRVRSLQARFAPQRDPVSALSAIMAAYAHAAAPV